MDLKLSDFANEMRWLFLWFFHVCPELKRRHCNRCKGVEIGKNCKLFWEHVTLLCEKVSFTHAMPLVFAHDVALTCLSTNQLNRSLLI